MPLIPNQPNLLFENKEFSEDEHYYLATRIHSEFFVGRFQESVQRWATNKDANQKSFSSYKLYENLPSTSLKPNLKVFHKINWEKTVLNRASARGFLKKPIQFSELSNLLVMSCGLKENGKWLSKPKNKNHWARRALPSGGAMYSLEYYILALNVTGLKPGLYYLNILQGGLSLLRSDEQVFDLDHFLSQRKLFKDPSAIIFVSSVFHRARVKYGPRALRYILLEAGGVGVQMNLLSTAMNLDFCFDGGGYESRIEKIIGIDGYREGIVTSFMVGHST